MRNSKSIELLDILTSYGCEVFATDPLVASKALLKDSVELSGLHHRLLKWEETATFNSIW